MNRNSLVYWFPLIEHLPLRMPQTGWFPVDCFKVMEEPATYVDDVTDLIEQMGLSFPVFLRTDHSSVKHDYSRTCYLSDPDDVASHLFALADGNLCRDLMFEYICVREFIPLEWGFKAFRGLPIAPERRYFIRDGEVECHHPYWPEDAIRFWGLGRSPSLAEARFCLQELDRLNAETPKEVGLLSYYAQTVADHVGGYWSVDFAKSRDEGWVLVDMAEGARSWHPECPHKGGASE